MHNDILFLTETQINFEQDLDDDDDDDYDDDEDDQLLLWYG